VAQIQSENVSARFLNSIRGMCETVEICMKSEET
jgi:hypothetical protein